MRQNKKKSVEIHKNQISTNNERITSIRRAFWRGTLRFSSPVNGCSQHALLSRSMWQSFNGGVAHIHTGITTRRRDEKEGGGEEGDSTPYHRAHKHEQLVDVNTRENGR